jgi:hypothetical protein
MVAASGRGWNVLSYGTARLVITAILLPQRLSWCWGKIVSLRMHTNLRLVDLRLTTVQQRSTGQNLPSILYKLRSRSLLQCVVSILWVLIIFQRYCIKEMVADRRVVRPLDLAFDDIQDWKPADRRLAVDLRYPVCNVNSCWPESWDSARVSNGFRTHYLSAWMTVRSLFGRTVSVAGC